MVKKILMNNDPRIEQILNLIMQIASGNLEARETRSEKRDGLDAVIEGLNMLAEELLMTTVSKDYVDSIIKSMVDSLIVVNPDATIRTVNQATLNLLGYEEKEVIGKNIAVITSKEEVYRGSGIEELIKNGFIQAVEKTYLTKDGRKIPVLFSGAVMRDEKGDIQGIVCVAQDITERKQAEELIEKSLKEKEKLIAELQNALSEINTLRGILPICSFCKKIRDDKGYWNQVESYFKQHSEIVFSHSLCPECTQKHYPDFK